MANNHLRRCQISELYFFLLWLNGKNHHPEDLDVSTIDIAPETIIPERYKLWIMTFGCAHNFADGEYMKVNS